MTVVPWLFVIVLLAVLGGFGTHNLFRSRGGTPLQALSAGGTAGAAVFTAGMLILNTVT